MNHEEIVDDVLWNKLGPTDEEDFMIELIEHVGSTESTTVRQRVESSESRPHRVSGSFVHVETIVSSLSG